MRGRAWSLRTKLLGVMLLTTLVAVLVTVGAMVGYDLRSYHQGWITDLETQSALLARTTAPALLFSDANVAQENLAVLRFRPQVRAAAIYNARGALFARYARSDEADAFPRLPGAEGVRIDNGELRLVRQIVENGEILGSVYLRADYALFERLKYYAAIGIAAAFAAMVVAWLLSRALQKVVTRPIFAIEAIARDVVSQRDYSRRAEKVSDDEVGHLVESFNEMLAEIERRTQETEASRLAMLAEAEERRVAQEEVMRLNERLERRVQERTAELSRTNEELIVAREAADAANQAKSAFLSSMSHELRTPLNAILGFAQILASDRLPSTPAQQREFTQHILKAGNHLLQLVNEVLDLAKIESGTLSMSLEPVALAELFTECQSMLEPLAKNRDIRLLFPAAPDMQVVADRTRLKQVMLNLLSNSIKYNRDLGTVVVDCVPAGEGTVRISIQDTGKGLTQDELASLFQPFNRLGQETGTEEGTGIGLVVTRRLVELMGGQIDVASTPGVGSIFSIVLEAARTAAIPARRPPAAALPELRPAASDSVPIVLYVEDNPANLRLVENVLSFRTDCRLLSAPDGKLGLELARAHLPQVVLMDINLPGLNGVDCMKVLRADPLTAHIPVIAVSANAMPRDIQKGLAEGFFRYLTKPIDIEELSATLDLVLKPAAGVANTEKGTA